MSRTNIAISCRAAHVQLIAALFDNPPHATARPWGVELLFEDVHLGFFPSMPDGVPFHGHHEDGDDHGPGRFAHDGKMFTRLEVTHDGNPGVPFTEDGRPDPDTLAEIAEHYANLARAKALIAAPAAPRALPPDPEGLNDSRADRAEQALRHFAQLGGQKPEFDGWDEILRDLLCNLRHFCDRNGLDFAAENNTAHGAYQEETAAP